MGCISRMLEGFFMWGYAECSKFSVCGKSDFDEEGSVIKTEREGVCDVCED